MISTMRTNRSVRLVLWLFVIPFQVQGGPHLFIKNQSHDFGLVAPESPLSHTFHLRNVGDSPLVVNEIATTCSCISTILGSTTVPSGATVPLAISLMSGNLARSARYQLMLRTNDPIPERGHLEISFQVLPQFTFSPQQIYLGDLLPCESAKRVIRLSYLRDSIGRTQVLNATSSNHDVQVVQDDFLQDLLNQVKINVIFSGRKEIGPIHEKVAITTTNNVQPSIVIPVEQRFSRDIDGERKSAEKA